MKQFIPIAVGLMLSAPVGVQARELECEYDYVTHVAVNRISEDSKNNNLNVISHHEIGSGGREMYMFELSPTAEKTLSLKHISGKLFWYENGYLTELVYVDFEKALLRGFQYPEHAIEQSTQTLAAPLTFWECHRID